MTVPEIASQFSTNLLGMLLMITLLLTKGWKIPASRHESRILLIMILATIAGCLLDPLAWLMDGHPGAFARFMVYASNTLLYSLNIVIGPGFITLIARHIREKLPRGHRLMIIVLSAVELALLIINFFVPVVFSVDAENFYHRQGFFWSYIAVELGLLLYGLALYIHARLSGRLLRFFPTWLFFVPLVVGVSVQCFVYGVSLIWPSVGVSFCALVICLQNESIFLDKLTGVFNRYYLDDIHEMLKKRRRGSFAALMLDMNGFKAINDRYSHAEGDAALVAVARILTGIVKNSGMVIRFAGDEFVILLEHPEEGCVEETRLRILSEIDRYNSTSGKPYKLSAAVGGSVFDAERDDISDFLSIIDHNMYEDKKDYYRSHDRRENR